MGEEIKCLGFEMWQMIKGFGPGGCCYLYKGVECHGEGHDKNEVNYNKLEDVSNEHFEDNDD